MPPKTIKCAICSETVMKSQTYNIGDGKRACKSHEGVEQKSIQAQAFLQKKHNKNAEIRKPKQREIVSPFEMSPKQKLKMQIWANYTCMESLKCK